MTYVRRSTTLAWGGDGVRADGIERWEMGGRYSAVDGSAWANVTGWLDGLKDVKDACLLSGMCGEL